MPDKNTLTNATIELRRFPLVHRPLKWFRNVGNAALTEARIALIRKLFANSKRLGPPIGTFSVYNRLRSGDQRIGGIAVKDQGNPKLPEPSMQLMSGLQQHALQPWPIFWSHHPDATLVSSSLALLNDKKQVSIESVYGSWCVNDDPAYRYFSLPEPLRLKGNWTSLVSRWVPAGGVPTFTHWILDALPRLAMLKEFPSDTGILVPSKLAGYQKESLKLLGLLDRCRMTPETHLSIENYYFSSPHTIVDAYNPFGIEFLRSQFLPKMDHSYSGPKKFIIQRKGKTRGITNEAEVNAFFLKLGWSIIDTEKLTFAQEIKLFSEAEAVSGVFGSGFTNMIWCKPGCKMISLYGDSFLDGYIEWIADVLKLDWHFEIFPSDYKMRTIVDMERLTNLLRKAGEIP